MKLSIIFIAVLFSLSSWAKPVEGEIFYKKSDGDVARRAVTLEVPSKGEGEVVLRGNGFEWRSTDFWTKKKDNGQIMFIVAFKTEFMDKPSTIAFVGTYLKGSNEIIYNGNFYKKEGHDFVRGDDSDFRYEGGFSFNYLR
jgi:hypothetical protein